MKIFSTSTRKVGFTLTSVILVFILFSIAGCGQSTTSSDDSAFSDESLILYFSFDELNGNQTIDHSQHENHGTLVGNPRLVDGKFGKALEFNGQSDWVEIPHDDSLTVDKGVTVMAWIHTPRHHGPNGVPWQGIIAKGNNPRSYSFYTQHPGSLHLSVNYVGVEGLFGSNSTEQVQLNEWQHVVAQVDNGIHRYWINGKNAGEHRSLDSSTAISLPSNADSATVRIGNTHDARHFLGRIDEVRVWNRALSEAEIIEQMQTGYREIVSPQPAQRKGDVNGDGVVNIQDLVLVAGTLGTGAAAPSAVPQALKLLTAAEVQAWLTQAQGLHLTDARSQRGIHFLLQLLLALTPKETALLANYPNPFNPETWIPYHLANNSNVSLSIYDINGALVRVLDLGHQRAGYYTDRSRAAYLG